MKKYILTLLTLGLLAFTSCRETVISTADIKIPERLVLGCFISPQDDTINASLSLSRPLYGRRVDNWDWQFEMVTNATLRLSDGSNTVTLSYNAANEVYQIPTSSLPIVGGKTYTLTAETPDGKRIKASCTVPSAQNFNARIQATSTNNSSNWDWRIRYTASWDRLPGPQRFFRLNPGYNYSNSSFNNEWFSYSTAENLFEPQFYSDNDLVNGQFLVRQELFPGWGGPGTTRYALNGMLQELDEHSFRYLSSLRAQYLSGTGGFSEPVVVYSNVENGIGCFGASYKYQITGDTLSVNRDF